MKATRNTFQDRMNKRAAHKWANQVRQRGTDPELKRIARRNIMRSFGMMSN